MNMQTNFTTDEFLQLKAENKCLRLALEAVEFLINNSSGVTGLHINGDDASWDTLRMGGCYEDWLYNFDKALDSINSTN